MQFLFLMLSFLLLPFSQSDPVPGKVQFIPNFEEINSFKELVDRFPDKVLYIDLWATWCPPCRQEFSYTDELKSFAENKDIEFVYISLNKPAQVGAWKRFLNQNQISGNHMLANDSFRGDLQENFYNEIINGVKQVLMPTYIIVDKNGVVYHKDARRPSEKKRLYKQLKRALKK